MRLGFISDLHLAPGMLNRCTTPCEVLLSQIEELETCVDKIITVGDLFDLMRPDHPRAWRKHLEHIRQEHPVLCAKLESFQGVCGNHDVARANLGVSEEFVWCTDRFHITVMHGHQSDPMLKKIWGLEEAANFVAGWLVRKGWNQGAQTLGKVPDVFDALMNRMCASKDAHNRTMNWAMELASRSHKLAPVVVFGHTHKGCLIRTTKGSLCLNTGSHTLGESWISTFDSVLGEVRLYNEGQEVVMGCFDGQKWHLQGDPDAIFEL